MRSYLQSVADQRLLLETIQSKAFQRLDWMRQEEVVSMAQRAGANIECYAAFEDTSNRDAFLSDAYRLQSRAWMRLQRLIVAGAAFLAFSCISAPASAESPVDIGRPVIGTAAYSAGCVIEHAWEDGSAVAYCPEDGARYAYDPDGQPYVNAAGVPIRAAGWYVIP